MLLLLLLLLLYPDWRQSWWSALGCEVSKGGWAGCVEFIRWRGGTVHEVRATAKTKKNKAKRTGGPGRLGFFSLRFAPSVRSSWRPLVSASFRFPAASNPPLLFRFAAKRAKNPPSSNSSREKNPFAPFPRAPQPPFFFGATSSPYLWGFIGFLRLLEENLHLAALESVSRNTDKFA